MSNETALHTEAEIEIYYKELQDLIVVYTAHLNHLRYQFFKQFDLSSHQYAFLKAVLSHHPLPISMMKARELMPEKMSDVTRIAARLENEGLIKRRQDAGDKRVIEVSITEKGLELIKEVDQKSSVLTEHYKILSKDEIELLNKFIKKMSH